MVTAEELKQIFLFKNVSDPVLRLVAEAAEEVTFMPGDVIAEEDEPAQALVLIRSGSVRATREGLSAPVFFGAGESMGQVSLLDGGPAGMTAVAIERVEAVALRPAKLIEKLGGHPAAGFELFRAVARSLAGRLRRAFDALPLTRDTDAGAVP